MPPTVHKHRLELLTASQAAALHRVNVSTVNRWAKAGRLPVALRTPGGINLFHPADVKAFDPASTDRRRHEPGDAA